MTELNGTKCDGAIGRRYSHSDHALPFSSWCFLASASMRILAEHCSQIVLSDPLPQTLQACVMFLGPILARLRACMKISFLRHWMTHVPGFGSGAFVTRLYRKAIQYGTPVSMADFKQERIVPQRISRDPDLKFTDPCCRPLRNELADWASS